MRLDGTLRTAWIVILCASLVLGIAVGIRHGIGLFLQPMSADNGWGREVFAFAIAIQNLIWGVLQPFTGTLADRYGPGKVMAAGAVLYAIALAITSQVETGGALLLSMGVLMGIALTGTSFSVTLAAVTRVVSPANRGRAMGWASAVGSVGQFLMLPYIQSFISLAGWSAAMLAIAVLAFMILPLSFGVKSGTVPPAAGDTLTAREAIVEAFQHRGFWLLVFGFFVCGFQVVFLATHLPAFLVDKGLSSGTAATVLALVGLFNIAGSFIGGWLGDRYPKPWVLSSIYALRGISMVLFAFLPVTLWSAYAFGVALGFLWLATVPLTNGTVASIFGVKNMTMLTGIVFFSHQLGSFFGGWLGGAIFDRIGSYDPVWLIAIGLSVVATLVHLPIREVPVPRLAGATR